MHCPKKWINYGKGGNTVHTESHNFGVTTEQQIGEKVIEIMTTVSQIVQLYIGPFT